MPSPLSLSRGAPLVAALLVTATPALGANDDFVIATFAGGCFWSMEAAFDGVEGVISTTSGYTGGRQHTAAYKVIAGGGTGHAEAVEIRYDPDKVSYQELLNVFWINHDPTTNTRQFCDRGLQYRPGIYFHDAEQKRLAEQSRQRVMETHSFPVLTEITRASEFYAAEQYHQNYKEKNPQRYASYRALCGRDTRLEEMWGEQEKS